MKQNSGQSGVGPERTAGRHIHVACALIERDGLVLAAQRSAAMSMPLKWEFPGGKIDSGETPPECLKRELLEELGVTVDILKPLSRHTHQYQDFTVTLHPFVCSITSGAIVLHEHSAIEWLDPEALFSLDWAEADGPLIDEYCRQLKGRALRGKEVETNSVKNL